MVIQMQLPAGSVVIVGTLTVYILELSGTLSLSVLVYKQETFYNGLFVFSTCFRLIADSEIKRLQAQMSANGKYKEIE